MHIEKSITAPNYAVLNFHRVAQLVVTDAVTIVTVRGYGALDNPLIGWEDRIEMPNSTITANPDPMLAAATALIAPGGYLEGGTIVAQD